ncbi:hypothetical protein J19TS2_09540 [Cohnella xylanilytica]|nr:hypothetical protein J19TS2_09540 [Cohnella xylanilytica]
MDGKTPQSAKERNQITHIDGEEAGRREENWAAGTAKIEASFLVDSSKAPPIRHFPSRLTIRIAYMQKNILHLRKV